MKGIIGITILLAVWLEQSEGKENVPVICSTCECLGNTRPYDVDCMNLELSQVPDLSTNNFTFPWILNFDNNLIRDIPLISKQDQLLSLNFKRNRISSIADGAFKDVPNLKELYLQRNNITGDSLNRETFKGHYNSSGPEPLGLEVLDLSYNNIRSLKTHTFVHLTSLTKLLLAHNPMRDISIATGATINELTNLHELDLSQTGLDRLPNHFLSDLVKLQILTLAGNKFITVPGEIRYAHNLVMLNLNANPILSLTLGDFQENLRTLRVLEISALPELRTVGAHTFSELKSLEKLSMSSCPSLNSIDPLAFYVMEGDELNLKEIHIQDNHLKTLSEDLLPWLQIQAVDIQNNPWQCDCHLRWIAEKLIPDLERKNPGLTLSILCAEPMQDRGKPVVEMLSSSDSFECKPPRSPYSPDPAVLGPLSIGIMIVGALLLLTGSMVFAYVLFRRSQIRQFGDSVKYRRAAHNEEMESVQA